MQILIAIIILLAFVLILYFKHKLNSASHKGKVGERRVYSRQLAHKVSLNNYLT